MCHINIFLMLLPMQTAHALIKVGGLFETSTENTIDYQESAFRYAIRMASEKFKNDNFEFETSIKTYKFEGNSLEAGKSVCSLMREGIAGIFGPQRGDSHYITQAICDNKEIPHILTRWELDQRKASCSVNLYPQAHVLAKVFSDVVAKWEWRKYTILYENTESLMRISTLLKAEFNETTTVQLKRLDSKGPNYRPLLREIKESDYSNIILDCSLEVLKEILKQAQQVGLMGSDHSFIITNLDFHTLDLEPYRYGGTNITGFRFFDSNSEYFAQTINKLNEFINESNNLQYPLTTLELDLALTIDAVTLYTEAIGAILDTEEKRTISPVSCDTGDAWPNGFSVINHMKMNIMNGLTGVIQFDHQGFRSDFEIHIVELQENGLYNVGKWVSNEIKLYQRKSSFVEPQRTNSLRNVTFNVVFPLTPPYGMLVNTYKHLKGNEQYEGFCVDLIKKLSEMNQNFSVNFIISKDRKSGSPHLHPNKTITWDGMVGDILNGVADLACGDLTVNREREEVVDITSVFMNLGIAILYKKPHSDPPGFFSFLSPFKTEVWILVVTAYCSVSLMFFVMGRISPYEWTNPFPCVQEPDELENQFTLSNSFWFTAGALMQQGSDIAPISVSTRMAAGSWWFFTLIMVSCYTANLAAFLTTENPNEEFTNIEELAQQTEIKYGAKKDGTTLQFFNESSEPLHKQMFNYMMVHADDVLVDSTAEGVERAVREKYAFLMESSQIEYETERKCSLTQIGKPIDDKGYGIAMKKGSWYLGLFSQSILKMQEEGTLNDLKRKWWKEKYAGSCGKEEKNDAETLGLANLGGMFIVLGGGVVVAILIAILEQFLYAWSLSREEAIPMQKHLKKELKFFLRCRGTTKSTRTFKNGSDKDVVLTYE